MAKERTDEVLKNREPIFASRVELRMKNNKKEKKNSVLENLQIG
jgi:hypothetical protein